MRESPKLYCLQKPTTLEKKIVDNGGNGLSSTEWRMFSNGELFVSLNHTNKNAVVLGHAGPPNENFFATNLLLDTLRRSGSERILLVLPYFGYSRQDRLKKEGDPVTVQMILRTFACNGCQKIITIDLHSERIIEDSPIEISDISMMPLFAQELKSELTDTEYTVVSPDTGGIKQAQLFCKELKTKNIVVLDKKRDEMGNVKAAGLNGKVRGFTAVIVDDILDTGGTISEAVKLLRDHGFTRFYLCVTHALFSLSAVSIIRDIGFERILVSNTIDLPESVLNKLRITLVDASKIIEQSIYD